ncbi:sensor histidine kinase [Actinomyces naeslundii]|uniref:Sensor histidine kinase n=1 Tax=Actinomyces naeslundii TaxID=1655 RepID=A0AA47FJB8_ACTNA|nr:sensor histidine kinase [Actinomyces naeslundii]OMG17930.1 two-component sensor histidine kinase [Actinomyces naeslundii]WAL43366.1 sensor histidine kinase [Actinomyces naeslundii]
MSTISSMTARALSPDEARARRTRAVAVGWGIVWAAFMVPVVRVGLAQGSSGGVWGAVSAIVSCACLYAACSLSVRRVRQGLTWPSRLSLLLIVVGALTATGAALGVGSPGLQLVVFLAVVLAFSLPWQAAIGPIAILTGILFLIPRMIPSWSASEDAWIALLGAGSACVFGRYIMEQRRMARILEQRTHELEINEERNRMARDMHDILGHSLTVIALKSELATRLVDVAPDQARAELDEVQSLARSALADVRATVNSYRELSLAGELARATGVLTSAGIRADLPLTVEAVDPELRELFAWVVREGVTNVVRHARASHCKVELTSDSVEVTDDGIGLDSAGAGDGHGLEGLRQRCQDNGADLTIEAPSGGSGTVLRASARRLSSRMTHDATE